MSNSELRRQLNELAEEFVAGVLRAIQNVPLSQLATGVSEASSGRGAKRAAGAAKKTAGAAKKAASKPAGGKRKLARRSPGALDDLRANILKVLRGAASSIGASEIAKQVGGGVKTPDLSFPLSQLRSQKLVQKQGERTQAVYSITERGRSEGPTDRRKGRGAAKKSAVKKSATKKSATKKTAKAPKAPKAAEG